jgi:tetratricopeptide (TPR) repeat protein
MVYKDQGKTEQAIAAFQSAVERNPDMVEAWVILGDLMDRTHNPLAIQYFDNAFVSTQIMWKLYMLNLLFTKQ